MESFRRRISSTWPGEGLHGLDDAPAAEQGYLPPPSHPQGEEGEHHELAGEGLGGRHPDLGPGVQVAAEAGLASDGGAHHIDDAHGARSPAASLPQRGQGVRRLSRLADRDDQRALVQHRVLVAELRGVLDLDRNARQVLEHVLADQRRVPAGSAGGHHHAIHGEKLFLMALDPA